MKVREEKQWPHRKGGHYAPCSAITKAQISPWPSHDGEQLSVDWNPDRERAWFCSTHSVTDQLLMISRVDTQRQGP